MREIRKVFVVPNDMSFEFFVKSLDLNNLTLNRYYLFEVYGLNINYMPEIMKDIDEVKKNIITLKARRFYFKGDRDIFRTLYGITDCKVNYYDDYVLCLDGTVSHNMYILAISTYN